MTSALPVSWMSNNTSKGCIFADKAKLPRDDLWVFGYGSLMWNPGFPFYEAIPAKVFGYHRSLCIQSIRYRGTPERPGLVFGLDRGGSCAGIAFHVALANLTEVIEYLKNREMVNGVYRAMLKPIKLTTGDEVGALTFIVRREHPSYTRNLTIEQTASIVSQATGKRGKNLEYVKLAADHLETLGIKDRTLREVCTIAACSE